MADVIQLSSSCLFNSLNNSKQTLVRNPNLNYKNPFRRVCKFVHSTTGANLDSMAPPSSPISSNQRRKRTASLKVQAVVAEATDQPKWWERNAGPNMVDIHSTEEFLSALSEAGDRLVIVEFYGTWCASCRALFPRLCRTAEDHPEILFLKVNFDENKAMCKSMNVKVLPYFHFYRGADGQVDAFSCSLAKFQKLKDAIETQFQKLKDAIETHHPARRNDSPKQVDGNLRPDSSSSAENKSAESNNT